jgi:lysophospholipase L1-like esterase
MGFRVIERRVLRSVVPAAMLVTCLTLSGCALESALGSEPTPGPTPVVTETPAPPTAVVVVGDSLVEGDHDATPADPGSWLTHLTGNVEVVDGWWRNGATTKMMADNLPVSRGDVLIIMGGTNDADRGVRLGETVESIERIAQKVSADDVILCAIPPLDTDGRAAADINEELQELAADSGWAWVDPWEFFRDGDKWTDGASTDGMHPTESVYRSVGLVISEAIERVTVTRVG